MRPTRCLKLRWAFVDVDGRLPVVGLVPFGFCVQLGTSEFHVTSERTGRLCRVLLVARTGLTDAPLFAIEE